MQVPGHQARIEADLAAGIHVDLLSVDVADKSSCFNFQRVAGYGL
jgi:hypothetical protein